MPELPEVETIVSELKKVVLGRKIEDVWSDTEKMIGPSWQFQNFQKNIKGETIKNIKRRGKNIILKLTKDKWFLIHHRMTGHLLYGKWTVKVGRVTPVLKGHFLEKENSYIHLLFFLDNDYQIALSDLRKFAKVKFYNTGKDLKKDLMNLGPEPLEKKFTFRDFKKMLRNKKGKIKQVLMDQSIISGIGNIYSDEILWRARVCPLEEVFNLGQGKLKRIFNAVKKTLFLAVKMKGASVSDFRRILGDKGFFAETRKVYRREGEKCFRCQEKIKRIKIGGRSAHFCPCCQRE